jgi:hypothetical protein
MKKESIYSDNYLLRIQPSLLSEAKEVADTKGMSMAAWIRQAISRSITYHNKVEKPVYEQFRKGASEAEPPTPFFSTEFGVDPLG